MEIKQQHLENRLDTMSVNISSLHQQNTDAICEVKNRVNLFLNELISVVGSQFAKMQAELKQSQTDHVKVCVCDGT